MCYCPSCKVVVIWKLTTSSSYVWPTLANLARIGSPSNWPYKCEIPGLPICWGKSGQLTFPLYKSIVKELIWFSDMLGQQAMMSFWVCCMEGWMLTVVTFVLAWWQNEMHPYLRPGNEQTAEARVQDRQEKATFAKAGVRRRRIHMQVQKRTSSAVRYLFMGHYKKHI
jgi:hypothetical protein